MCFSIVGRKIEPEVMIYDVYTHSKNKLSVIVGEMPKPGGHITVEDKVRAFLEKFPMFDSKFVYEDFSWPCFENKQLLVSVFRFRHPEYRIRLNKEQKFFKNKTKAIHSKDGFLDNL